MPRARARLRARGFAATALPAPPHARPAHLRAPSPVGAATVSINFLSQPNRGFPLRPGPIGGSARQGKAAVWLQTRLHGSRPTSAASAAPARAVSACVINGRRRPESAACSRRGCPARHSSPAQSGNPSKARAGLQIRNDQALLLELTRHRRDLRRIRLRRRKRRGLALCRHLPAVANRVTTHARPCCNTRAPRTPPHACPRTLRYVPSHSRQTRPQKRTGMQRSGQVPSAAPSAEVRWSTARAMQQQR